MAQLSSPRVKPRFFTLNVLREGQSRRKMSRLVLALVAQVPTTPFLRRLT
jgi:hypothetical protein